MPSKTSTKGISLVLQANEVQRSIKSFQFSKVYVKRLIKISILNIAHQRIDIPEAEFETKEYEKVPYVFCVKKSRNKIIRTFHSIGSGIMDAVDKDYLKEIKMYIIHKETRKPLETYLFKVKYNKEVAKSDQKPATIKLATKEFLKALSDIPGKKLREDDVELHIELFYNEDTPREYEPPNFEATKESLSARQPPKYYELGKITTGFHKISTYGSGANFSDSRASTPAPNFVMNEDEDIQDLSLLEIEPEDEPDPSRSSPKKKRREIYDYEGVQSKKSRLDTSDANVIISESDGTLNNINLVSDNEEDTGEEYVCCLCNWDLPKNYETIKCSKCCGSVHQACYGYINSNDVDREKFLCFSCGDLKKGNLNSLTKLMQLRIILYGIYMTKRVPEELSFAPKDIKNYILGQLEKFGVRSSTSTSREDINLNGLNKAIQSVFYETETSQYFE